MAKREEVVITKRELDLLKQGKRGVYKRVRSRNISIVLQSSTPSLIDLKLRKLEQLRQEMKKLEKEVGKKNGRTYEDLVKQAKLAREAKARLHATNTQTQSEIQSAT